MAITYDSGLNKINVRYATGDARGNSFKNGWRLIDIYNEDLANSWNVVLKEGNTYTFKALLDIQGVTCFFQDSYVNIQFDIALTANTTILDVKTTNFNLGEYEKPCTLTFLDTTKAQSAFVNILNTYECAIYNTTFINFRSNLNGLNASNIMIFKYCNVYNTITFALGKFMEVDFLDAFDKSSITINDNALFSNMRFLKGSTFYTNHLTDYEVKNIKFFDNAILKYLLIAGLPTFEGDKVAVFVDSNIPNTLTSQSHISYQESLYTVLLKTTFISQLDAINYNLKLYDKDNNIVVEQDNINSFEEEIIYQKNILYSPPSSAIITNTETIYTPFKAVVSKVGYNDLTIPDINIVKGQATIIRGELVETPAPIPLPPTITSVAITEASSQTATDGQITIIATSGTQPYQYSLNGTDWQATGIFSGLAKGTYEVHVKDDNDLTDSIDGVEVPGESGIVYIDQMIGASMMDIEEIHASLEIEESINTQMEEVMTITTDMQIG